LAPILIIVCGNNLMTIKAALDNEMGLLKNMGLIVLTVCRSSSKVDNLYLSELWDLHYA
jgi:hypothetical protein